MGSLFSSPNKTYTQDEYNKQLAELKVIAEEQAAQELEAERTRTNTIEAQYKRQKEIAQRRIAEIKETIRRAQELFDQRKMLNIQSAVLLCALYFNYPFGKLDVDALDESVKSKEIDPKDNSWQTNALEIVKIAVNENVFWLLCKIPQLLPLLWPTGKTEDKFHEYKLSRKENGTFDPKDYQIDIKALVKPYCEGPLKTYITNVFQANCDRSLDSDYNYAIALDQQCANFIMSVEGCADDTQWLQRAIPFLQNEDPMKWKTFSARSGKGICKNKIELLPSTYPHICPKYELYEALIILANTVINNYGSCKTSKGLDVAAKRISKGKTKVKRFYSELTFQQKQKYCTDKNVEYKDRTVIEIEEDIYDMEPVIPDISGGKCFNIDKEFNAAALFNAFVAKGDWDNISYIPVAEINIPEEKITGEKDTKKWMTEIATDNGKNICEKLEVYYLTDTDRIMRNNGLVRYKNPTKRYSSDLLNDINGVEVPFQMPRLSADLNGNIATQFLYEAYAGLSKQENKEYNVLGCKNSALLTSMDYILCRPPELEEYKIEDDVFPLARYMYKLLIEYSCKWSIVVPINTTISMGQINSQIASLFTRDKSVLPQYLWTKTKNVVYNAVKDGESISEPKAPDQVDSKLTAFIVVV